MMNFFYTYLLLYFLRNNAFPMGQIASRNKGDFLEFGFSYIGDNLNNLSGGVKTGSCYLGMASIKISFDTEKAGLWKGGHFCINAANTHGSSPSDALVGDFQVVSNIQAGNHTFIQELWL